MNASLLDVNVLVALLDPANPGHEDAHHWFGKNRRRGWASCALTINGCVRVLSNPAYPTVRASAAEVVGHLRSLCSAAGHAFWPHSISLLDETRFRPARIVGHRMITDAYLLGLAVQEGGRLVTFDRSIPVAAVVGAESKHLVVLGSGPERES